MPAQSIKKPRKNKVILISPASPPWDAGAIDRNISRLTAKGFDVIEGKNLRKRNGFLAGTDTQRLNDLHEAFNRKDGEIILCYRGGSGSYRLLDKISPGIIKTSEKKFIGFSDITALHLYLHKLKYPGLFHGPVLNSLFNDNDKQCYSLNSFTDAVSDHKQSLRENYPDAASIRVIRRGAVKAPLIGGNLATICALVGTRYLPSLKGKILLLEDINEKPYQLDRFLSHLLNSGALKGIAGIACGIFLDCADPVKSKEYRQSASDVLIERLSSLKVPFVTGLPIGHGEYNATVPLGRIVTLDAKKGDLLT